MASIKIGAFEKKPLLRAGMVHVLNAEPGMQVVAEGHSLAQALSSIAELPPNVVILDSTLMETEIENVRMLARLSPSPHLLVLTSSLSSEQMTEGFTLDVKGYVQTGASEQEFITAVRAVANGEGYVSPGFAASILLQRPRSTKDSCVWALSQLSFRETQIYQMLAGGQKNKEIGSHLNLTEKSVKRYVTVIFEKLNVRNRVEAAMLSRADPKGGPHVTLVPVPVSTVQAVPSLANRFDLLQENRDEVIGQEFTPTPATVQQFSIVFGRHDLPMRIASRGLSNGTHIVL
jgi:DNA-binding NarL/FixJ family response regulator